jgi:Protein of unknown function (DUF3592)
MPQLVAMILTHSKPEFDNWLIWAILLSTALSILIKTATVIWPKIVWWWNQKRSHNWPSVSGVIDIAVVAKEVVAANRAGTVVSYHAMLTYSYRNPDLQTGDYNRRFTNEGDAQEWANSFKGRTVSVHVDPRDPTRSVLRAEDLDAAISEHS